jgi:hypothetical protein
MFERLDFFHLPSRELGAAAGHAGAHLARRRDF